LLHYNCYQFNGFLNKEDLFAFITFFSLLLNACRKKTYFTGSPNTSVIRALVKDLEPPFVTALQEWEQALSQTQATFVRYIEFVGRSGNQVNPDFYSQILELVQFAVDESNRFVQLLNQLGTESESLKKNPTAIAVLNHIRRESEYFIGIAQAYLSTSYISQEQMESI
jgi:hypothetical protein